MIQRSVPGYETVIAMCGLLASRFAKAGTNVYDLGCSLGATTLSLRHNLAAVDCLVIGVDNSPAMISRCRELVAADNTPTRVELVQADVCDYPLKNASMVVLNYTLQFIPLEQRLALLERAAAALRPGGILVLSEKVLLEDEVLNALNVELHHDFKRAHGYSDMEVAGKRDSLENVLLPETLTTHRERLTRAGFRSADVWFQCFNFASLIALK